MRKVLIATHGHLASGFKSAIELLTGEHPGLEAIDCYVDEADYTPRVEAWLQSIAPDDEAVVFTDIYGGSVCQKVALLNPEAYGAVHITGANLGLIIETVLTTGATDRTWAEQVVAAAREGMLPVQLASDATNEVAASSDDFFE